MDPEAPPNSTPIPPDAKYRVTSILIQAELSMLDADGLVYDKIITQPVIMHEAQFASGVVPFLKSKGLRPVE